MIFETLAVGGLINEKVHIYYYYFNDTFFIYFFIYFFYIFYIFLKIYICINIHFY